MEVTKSYSSVSADVAGTGGRLGGTFTWIGLKQFLRLSTEQSPESEHGSALGGPGKESPR